MKFSNDDSSVIISTNGFESSKGCDLKFEEKTNKLFREKQKKADKLNENYKKGTISSISNGSK